jgi:hypothetical protein
MLLEKQRMQQLELEERQRRRSIKEKDHGRSDGWLSPPPTASKPGSARSSTSMPDINQQKTSSTKAAQKEISTPQQHNVYLYIRYWHDNKPTLKHEEDVPITVFH